MKKLMSLILTLAMICGGLALCGNALADNTIKIWMNSGVLYFGDGPAQSSGNFYELGSNNYELTDDVSLDHPLLVPENTTATLDLRGKQLIKTGSYASEVIYIKNNGTLTLNDSKGGGTIENGKRSGVVVEAKGSFIMNDGCITKNTGGGNGGGGVYSAGDFQMNGGSITGNKASNGGGVYSAGDFQMKGGSITGNTAESASDSYGNGGGVYYNHSGGVMTISEKAEISGNTAKNRGGGVYVDSGTLKMDGGSIKNNEAKEYGGGGVYLDTGCHLKMTGGSITGNRADNCGGISMGISTGYDADNNRITVSGKPTISGNIASNQSNNVPLAYNIQHILVSGELTGGTIGVSVSDANQVVAMPTNSYTIKESDAEKFTSDDGVLGGVLEKGNVVLKKVITEDMVTVAPAVYNGENQIGSIDVTVKSGKTVLTKDTDYTLRFEKDGEAVKTIKDPGEYTVIVTGTGDYGRVVESTLTVEQKEVGLIWSGGPFTYNGKEQSPTAEATGLVKGEEVSVKVSGGQTDAGKKYTATAAALTGEHKKNYKLPADNTFAFSIEPKSITGGTVVLDTTQLTYTGAEQRVKVVAVVADGFVLAAGDYDVSGNTGTDKGSYTVTVTGKGNFTGKAAAAWQILEKAMTVRANDVSAVYDGKPHGVTVTVKDPKSGYTVKYGTAEGTYDLDASPTITEAGTLIVYYKVTAANYTDYTGSAIVTVTKVDPDPDPGPEPPTPEPVPEPVSISGAKIKDIPNHNYTGKVHQPKPKVTLGGKTLEIYVDYTVSFKNNINVGTATVTITGIGNYTGTKTATFSIVPKKVSSASLKYRKKDNVLVVSWKKAAGIDGYEIEYGTDKHFKGAEKVKVSATKKTEYKIEKPTAKKTWYVRIRAWKKVKGKKYYSEWKVVSKKIK